MPRKDHIVPEFTDWSDADLTFVRTLITRTLCDFAVNPSGRGGGYMCEILYILLVEQGEVMSTSEPLQRIADKYGITKESVRSSMRYTLTRAWKNGDPEVQYRYFSNTIRFQRGKPTESAFLITLAMQMRRDVREYRKHRRPANGLIPEMM